MANFQQRFPGWYLLMALAGLLVFSVPASAQIRCGNCAGVETTTLVEDFQASAAVMYGHFANGLPEDINGNDDGVGSTDFVIEKVLKSHDLIKGMEVLRLAKFVQAKEKFVVFFDDYKGNIYPFRAEVDTAGELLQYLASVLEIRDQPIAKRLRHYFNFLDSTSDSLSLDAYREFARANYSDYKDMAKTLPAKTIAGWLKDPKTPPHRFGLYASLLGHCGDPKVHGDLLRAMLDDPTNREGSGLAGMLAGYTMLQPKEGWELIQTVLKSDCKESYYFRYYGALRALRFFWGNPNTAMPKERILEGMGLAINQHDMADFVIEDLREWKAWEMTDKVLDLFGKKSHDVFFVRKAILRFALCSPSPRAVEFVRVQRRLDPAGVSDMEEILEFLEFIAPGPVVPPAVKEK